MLHSRFCARSLDSARLRWEYLQVEGIPLDRYLDHFTGLGKQEQHEAWGEGEQSPLPLRPLPVELMPRHR